MTKIGKGLKSKVAKKIAKTSRATKLPKKAVGRDFHDAQGHVGDKYFMYIIQEGVHSGGGVSCYFWFSSPSQLLKSIKNHMDFWQWRDGYGDASDALAKIIDSHVDAATLSNELRSQLDEYVRAHADIRLWAWGPFEDLCSGNDSFCVEVRTEFRESVATLEYDDSDGDVGVEEQAADSGDMSRPIAAEERDGFCQYLADTPT